VVGAGEDVRFTGAGSIITGILVDVVSYSVSIMKVIVPCAGLIALIFTGIVVSLDSIKTSGNSVTKWFSSGRIMYSLISGETFILQSAGSPSHIKVMFFCTDLFTDNSSGDTINFIAEGCFIGTYAGPPPAGGVVHVKVTLAFPMLPAVSFAYTVIVLDPDEAVNVVYVQLNVVFILFREYQQVSKFGSEIVVINCSVVE